MSLHRYSVFLMVVEQCSFIRAAEMLYLTPSAVSHVIAKLEEEFGFALFIRHRSGLKLTQCGEDLLPYIREIQRSEAALIQEVGQINGIHKGVVRVGVINSVMVTWLPPIVQGFYRLHPNIKIQIIQGGYADLLKKTQENMIDLAFTSANATELYGDNLTFLPLYHDRLISVVPQDFRSAARDYITMKEISQTKIIMQCEGNDADTIALLKTYRIETQPTYSVASVAEDSSMIALVGCGFGISIMPELVLMGTRLDQVKTLPISPCPYRILGLATNRPQYYTPATQKFVKYVQTFAAEEEMKNANLFFSPSSDA